MRYWGFTHGWPRLLFSGLFWLNPACCCIKICVKCVDFLSLHSHFRRRLPHLPPPVSLFSLPQTTSFLHIFDRSDFSLRRFEILNFLPCIVQFQMGIGIQGNADVTVPHQILEDFWIHPCLCHVRAICMTAYMGSCK